MVFCIFLYFCFLFSVLGVLAVWINFPGGVSKLVDGFCLQATCKTAEDVLEYAYRDEGEKGGRKRRTRLCLESISCAGF